jgi:hypothetical protein
VPSHFNYTLPGHFLVVVTFTLTYPIQHRKAKDWIIRKVRAFGDLIPYTCIDRNQHSG